MMFIVDQCREHADVWTSIIFSLFGTTVIVVAAVQSVTILTSLRFVHVGATACASDNPE